MSIRKIKTQIKSKQIELSDLRNSLRQEEHKRVGIILANTIGKCYRLRLLYGNKYVHILKIENGYPIADTVIPNTNCLNRGPEYHVRELITDKYWKLLVPANEITKKQMIAEYTDAVKGCVRQLNRKEA